MPTGYTAAVCDGTVTDFTTFALTCARAFGACIMQRDDFMSNPLAMPKHSTWHDEQIAAQSARLEELLAMSDDEKRNYGRAQIARRIAEMRASNEKADSIRDRLSRMLDHVRAYVPPTREHVGLKEFMEQQLTETIKHDGRRYYADEEISRVESSDPVELHGSEVDEVRKSIQYHTEQQAEERERTAGRRAWIAALYESLGAPIPA